MKVDVVSPLTGKGNIILEKRIQPEEIISRYQTKFLINVRHIFSDVKMIELYRCMDTGYRFFYPYKISGDDNFYRHFGKYDWYYLPWKWEHEKSLSLISPNDNVLEVGAASGNFLQGLYKRYGIKGTGLELNSEAVSNAKSDNFSLLNESIQDHAVHNASHYDVVCSYQVLEHIAVVKEVLVSMVACLKPGGKLIISVPNNDGYIKDNTLPSEILNMPPHHMGWWNFQSLKSLEGILPIKMTAVFFEPLQEVHADTFQYVMVKKILFNSEILTKIYWKLRLHILARPILKILSKYIKGHSIMMVFEKE